MVRNPSLYRVGYLARLPLRTPYPGVGEAVWRIIGRLPQGTEVFLDITGVGRGIYDWLVERGRNPVGVTMTGGMDVNRNDRLVSVPKSTLVSRLVSRVHAAELVVHRDLGDWPVLKRELLNFRTELTPSGGETWNARSGEHDDLVIATALALWGLGDDATTYGGLMRYYGMQAGHLDAERFAVGVDVGQQVDPTAICVMSRIDNPSRDDVQSEHFTA